eukprot:scaffold201875_cov23-Tisochrysis_lutea.AAC.1
MTILVDARVKLAADGSRIVHRRVPVRLTGVRVVPGLTARLFSCRAAFENDKISTFLNKDCCLQLPGGETAPMAPS